MKQKNEKQKANNLTQIPSINSKEANWLNLVYLHLYKKAITKKQNLQQTIIYCCTHISTSKIHIVDKHV